MQRNKNKKEIVDQENLAFLQSNETSDWSLIAFWGWWFQACLFSAEWNVTSCSSLVELSGAMRTLNVIWILRGRWWRQITNVSSLSQKFRYLFGLTNCSDELVVFGTPVWIFGAGCWSLSLCWLLQLALDVNFCLSSLKLFWNFKFLDWFVDNFFLKITWTRFFVESNTLRFLDLVFWQITSCFSILSSAKFLLQIGHLTNPSGTGSFSSNTGESFWSRSSTSCTSDLALVNFLFPEALDEALLVPLFVDFAGDCWGLKEKLVILIKILKE